MYFVNQHLYSWPPLGLSVLTKQQHFRLVRTEAFAYDKINVTQKLKFVLRRVENIMGKGENDGYQHFLLSPQCFQKLSSSGSIKARIVC